MMRPYWKTKDKHVLQFDCFGGIMKQALAGILFAFLFVRYAATNAPRYSVSVDNSLALKKLEN